MKSTVLLSFLGLGVVAYAVPTNVTPRASVNGIATFYGGNLSGGMCSFQDYTLPAGLDGTALTDQLWDHANACGMCIQVRGPNGKTVKVMVVDQCPGCKSGQVDLFPNAFSSLANPSAGIINVSWEQIPCNTGRSMSLRNKSGTSKYWFSMQVLDANIPVTKLEVSTDGGKTWRGTTRQPYNYFEYSSGFGTDTVSVRVTAKDGRTIVTNNVSIAANKKTSTNKNF